jgi:hypothetical protein
MPQNYNFVGSSSEHTPLPATHPSATKKTQKGASSKCTHSRSINLEDADDDEPSNKKRITHSRSINLEDADDDEPSNKKRMTWTTKEDERLVNFLHSSLHVAGYIHISMINKVFILQCRWVLG